MASSGCAQDYSGFDFSQVIGLDSALRYGFRFASAYSGRYIRGRSLKYAKLGIVSVAYNWYTGKGKAIILELRSVRTISYSEAIREALAEEMSRDPSVFILGEDVGAFGGVFGVTQGLFEEFGPERVRDTPISEAAIVGAALGAALMGMRPVAEIMFGDFVTVAMDQLVNQAAKARYMSGGKAKVPLTIRVATGAPGSAAAQHSQSVESWFLNVPGLQIVIPATPYDAKGLLKTAIRDNNPVIFLEHKKLYNTTGEVPQEEYLIPFGAARLVTVGRDVSLIAVGYMVHLASQVAQKMEEKGLQLEVIDVRTLAPLDIETIAQSVRKTHKAVVIAEDNRIAGPTAEIASTVTEVCFGHLDAPVGRIGAKDTFIAHNAGMSEYVIPGLLDIQRGIEAVLEWE